MNIECPKCGFITTISQQELEKVDRVITCPHCMSTLKVVDGIAYIPTAQAPLEELERKPELPPQFKGEEYYEMQGKLDGLDPLYAAAVNYIKTCNAITLPMLQRHFNIEPERAEALMQQLEDNGVVAPFDGMHPRKILIDHNTGLPGMLSYNAPQHDPDTNGGAPAAAGGENEEKEERRVRSCTISLPGCGFIIFMLLLIYIIAHFLK